MRRYTRRTILTGMAAGCLCVACSRGSAQSPGERVAVPMVVKDGQPDTPTPAPAPPTQTPTPAPQPPPPRGTEVRTLLEGTASETKLYIHHSGVAGPAAIVLGGVHGNEPGGWLAGDNVAAWQPAKGSLLVVPRANVQALQRFVRTTDEIGDLNRLYPGTMNTPYLMEQMAALILDAAREFQATLLLDMHESWAFYAEYPPNSGTGALGQTVTAGNGPLAATIGPQIAERVNPQITAREQLIIRDGNRLSRPTGTPSPDQPNRGRSSLSAGGWVDGLTPVLVEMGQTDQPVDRRVDLHLLIARTALEIVGVL